MTYIKISKVIDMKINKRKKTFVNKYAKNAYYFILLNKSINKLLKPSLKKIDA